MEQHVIRRIRFLDRDNVPTFCQSQNGPCPLLALANVLALRNRLPVPQTSTSLSTSRLISMVAELILDANVPSVHEHKEYETHLRANITDSLNVLGKLAHGMDVNIRFDSPLGFEPTPEVAIFDLLGITLIHGWLVDPMDARTTEALGSRSYNEVVEMVVNAQDAAAAPPPMPSQHSTHSRTAAAMSAAGADADGDAEAVAAGTTGLTGARAEALGSTAVTEPMGAPAGAAAGGGNAPGAVMDAQAGASGAGGTGAKMACDGGGGSGGAPPQVSADINSLEAGLTSGTGAAVAPMAAPDLISFDDDDDGVNNTGGVVAGSGCHLAAASTDTAAAGGPWEPLNVAAAATAAAPEKAFTEGSLGVEHVVTQQANAEGAAGKKTAEGEDAAPADEAGGGEMQVGSPSVMEPPPTSPPAPPAPSPPPPIPSYPSIPTDPNPPPSSDPSEPNSTLPDAPAAHATSTPGTASQGATAEPMQTAPAAASTTPLASQAHLPTSSSGHGEPTASSSIAAEASPATADNGATQAQAHTAPAGSSGTAVEASSADIGATAEATADPSLAPAASTAAAAQAGPTIADSSASCQETDATARAERNAQAEVEHPAASDGEAQWPAAPAKEQAGTFDARDAVAANSASLPKGAAGASAGDHAVAAEGAPAEEGACAFAAGGAVAADGASTSAAYEAWAEGKRAHVAKLLKDAALAHRFLQATASQLTEHGIAAIQATLNDNSLAVFFRNNHFSCMFKHEGALYLLVTDQGYMHEGQVVWERLDAVGETQICGPDFKPYRAREPPPRVDMTALNSIPPQALEGLSEADAAAIAEAAGAMPSAASGHSTALVPAGPATTRVPAATPWADTQGDAALAAQLAREEEEAAAAAAAAAASAQRASQQQVPQVLNLPQENVQASLQQLRQDHNLRQQQQQQEQQAPPLPVSTPPPPVRPTQPAPHTDIPPAILAYQQKQQQLQQQPQPYMPLPPPPAAATRPAASLQPHQPQPPQPAYLPPAVSASQEPQSLQYVPELDQYMLVPQSGPGTAQQPSQVDPDADLALALHLQQQEEQEMAAAERRRQQQQQQQQPRPLHPQQQQLQQQQRQRQQQAGQRSAQPRQEEKPCVVM